MPIHLFALVVLALAVLLLLVSNSGRLVEKEKILETVWSDGFVEEGYLSVTITHLRKVLGDDAHNPTYIQTVARRGYRLVAEVREVPPPVAYERPSRSLDIGPSMPVSHRMEK